MSLITASFSFKKISFACLALEFVRSFKNRVDYLALMISFSIISYGLASKGSAFITLTFIFYIYSCPETTTFWGQFTDCWYQKFKQNLIINECIILYGWHQKSPNERVLNYALLLAKYHIFCSSVRNNKLDFDSFLSRLRTKLNILREVCLETKSFNNFQSTWAHLL